MVSTGIMKRRLHTVLSCLHVKRREHKHNRRRLCLRCSCLVSFRPPYSLLRNRKGRRLCGIVGAPSLLKHRRNSNRLAIPASGPMEPGTAKTNHRDKYVDARVECFRTRVQLPPPPPPTKKRTRPKTKNGIFGSSFFFLY